MAEAFLGVLGEVESVEPENGFFGLGVEDEATAVTAKSRGGRSAIGTCLSRCEFVEVAQRKSSV